MLMPTTFVDNEQEHDDALPNNVINADNILRLVCSRIDHSGQLGFHPHESATACQKAVTTGALLTTIEHYKINGTMVNSSTRNCIHIFSWKLERS